MYISPVDTRRPETGVAKDVMKKDTDKIEGIGLQEKIKIRIRFDYRGTPRPARFFFGGKGTKEVAEERREQQASMWRNVPLRGIQVEDIVYLDLYTVYDSIDEADITYAPMELLAALDSLEDCLQFVSRHEFKRLQVIEPSQISLNGRDIERILYKFSETIQHKLREHDET